MASSAPVPLSLGLKSSVNVVRYSRPSSDRRSACNRASLGMARVPDAGPRLAVGVAWTRGTPVGRMERGVAVGAGVGVGIAVAVAVEVGDCCVAGGGAGAVAAGTDPVPQATSTSTAIDSAVDVSQPGLFRCFRLPVTP